MAWMLNTVTGEPMKVTPAQLKDLDKSTRDILGDVTKVASSTGGSLIIFLALLPLVIRNLMSSMPQLAGILATISQAVKNPSQTADAFGSEMAETILSFPKGFFGELVGAGFDIGGDILGGVPEPFTPPEATPTGTNCERFEFDLIEIKRKLDDSSGLKKVQGTFAWIAKMFDMKRAGCSRPAFVDSSTWNKVPT